MKNYLLILLLAVFSCNERSVYVSKSEIETTSLLQAISIVDANTAWVSGHKATFALTRDGGLSWEVFRHPTGDTLQFRDVHAFDGNRVLLMSAGSGPLSRIFEFRNGVEWREYFIMDHPNGFLDCMDFWDANRGVAYGDAIDGYPYILLTDDGGRNWSRPDTTFLPRAGKGEGGFAASGTCVRKGEKGQAWIATGAGGNARILYTDDFGKSWRSMDTPMVRGEAAGHTSVQFVNDQQGFITGGDLVVSDAYTDNCAFTVDGGKTWKLTNPPITKGVFYGASSVNAQGKNYTFVCGPNGLDYTSDFGETWTQLDSANLWAVEMHSSGVGWATGRDGLILKIDIR